MQANKIRDLILATLRQLGCMAAVELNGHYFSGADVVIGGDDDNAEVFRIAVIPNKPQKNFT